MLLTALKYPLKTAENIFDILCFSRFGYFMLFFFAKDAHIQEEFFPLQFIYLDLFLTFLVPWDPVIDSSFYTSNIDKFGAVYKRLRVSEMFSSYKCLH